MVGAETLSEEAQTLLLHGMQNLVLALGEVIGSAADDEGVH
jgi:hypothetical protein